VLARATAAVNRVLASPDFAERIGRLGCTPRPTEPEWFRDSLRGQIERLTRQARKSGLEQSG
jgi:tripartite-type tricarboxylate transporter receptor subunit TctC